MGEHVVGRVLSNVHFVVFERVHGKVVSRVRWVVIHGLVKVGGHESAIVLMRERGGGGIDRHETVSRGIIGLKDLAYFPASDFRSGRTGRIGRGHGIVRTGVGGEGMMPGRGACHVEMNGGRRGEGISNGEELERHSESFIEIALWGTVEEGEEKSRPVRRESQGKESRVEVQRL